MRDEIHRFWVELLYHFDELLHCIHLKAFIASLPVAYATYFLGDWHLLEVYFFVSVLDLLLGVAYAVKRKKFSWRKVHSWSVKILVHFSTVVVVGVMAHVVSTALRHDVYILDAYVAVLTVIEIASVIKNARALQLPVPSILAALVAVVHKKAHKHVFSVLDEEVPENIKKEMEKANEDLKTDPGKDK